MKIIHFDYDDIDNPYAGGGQAKAALEIFSRLAKTNEVVIVTGNFPGGNNVTRQGISYKRIGIGNLGVAVSLVSYWLFIPLFCIFNNISADIISEAFTPPFTASLLPIFTKAPIVGFLTFFFGKELSAKYKLPFWLLEEFGLRNYKHFVALTTESSNAIKNIVSKANVKVIPRGIEQVYLKIGPRSENKYILFIGRLDIYQKGIDILIDAYSCYLSSGGKQRLVIAGNGSEKTKSVLKEKMRELGIINRIELVGRVDEKQKINLFENCSCVINPSRFETFGNVALEVLASGRTLVCFDIEGYRWIPKNMAIKIPNIDAKSLADQMINITENPDHYLQMQTRAKKFSMKFDWNNIASEYHMFISQIVKTV